MRWYVELSGTSKGPIEELELIKAIQAGSVTRGNRVCAEGTEQWVSIEAHPQFSVLFGMAVEDGTKICPYCSEPILAAAIKCKHCQSDLRAPVGDSRTTKSEIFGVLMLLVPLLSTFLVWFWVGGMNFLQAPGEKLLFIWLGTVGTTAMFGAIEAQSLGAGSAKDTDKKGRRRSGPITWFFGICLLWLFLYPAWLYQRSKYGLKNLLIGGVIVPICFSVSNTYMIGVLESKAQEVEESAAASFRRLHEENALPSSSPLVTLSKFERVGDGMTYDQVAAIIGAPGTLQSSSNLAGYKTAMYAWSNENGSSMNAMFQNGRLINKAQFGLH